MEKGAQAEGVLTITTPLPIHSEHSLWLPSEHLSASVHPDFQMVFCIVIAALTAQSPWLLIFAVVLAEPAKSSIQAIKHRLF